MTKGYIGKISAIVTVNTADAERAFNKSAADAQKFGANLQRTVQQATRDAGKSFDNIFTPLQKLQRAIQASKSASFNLGIKGLSAEELKRVEQLSLAARQLAAPLASAAKQFDGLGAAVQRGFSPALTATQTELLRVRDSMEMAADAGLEGFTGVARQVEKTVAAINQLAEASRQVASLPTGRELAFSDPRLAANLSAAQQAGRNALSLPSRAVQADPQLASLTQQINRVSELAVAAAARVKGAFSGQESATAQQDYDRLNTVLESLITKLNRRYTLFVDSEQSIRDAEQLQNVLARARLDQASTMLPVLQRESAAISRTGETLEQYESRLQAQADAKMRATASGQMFLRVLQQESDAISRTGETLDQYESRLRAAADAQMRAEVASTRLPVLQRESELLSNEGRAVSLDGNRNPRRRVLDELGGEVDSLRRRVGDLAEPLRATVGPEVDRLTTQFQNLARDGVGFTADQARRLSRELSGVGAALDARRNIAQRFGESFGGAGTAGLNLGIDERSLRSVGAQIEFVQGRLSALANEARGPVVAALQALRARAETLFGGGALDTEEGRRELELLRAELARTLAAAEGGSQAGIAASLQRVGDVARGSFGNVGLAVQQAAFAFEDFFSVTGGLDQRIRAAGNNLSQLGFILGSTKGLIAGITVGIGAQFAAMLIKWANNGQTAEDQVKALNDALARQKSLVEDLVRAFDSLGDAIARRAFSGPAQQARQFAQELADINKKQRELREARVADLDEGVQRERARQAAIQRQLESEKDAGRRVALAEELRQSQQREREAARAAAQRPLPTGAQVAEAITRAGDREFAARTRGEDTVTPADTRVLEEARRRAEAAAGASPLELRRILQGQLDDLTRGGTVQRDGAAAQSAAELKRLITALEDPARAAIDALANQVLQSSFAAALSIESAQQDVADAIRRGVPAAADFQAALDNTAKQLDEAQQQLRDAAQIEDPQAREAAVRQAQDRVNDIEMRRDAINERAREIRLGRTVGGERATAALSSLQGNERFANEFAGLTARLADAVDAELSARRELEQAIASGNQAAQEEARARLQAAQQTSDIAAALAEAALAMEEAVSRLRKILDGALSDSERIADDAQRQFTQNPTAENRRARDDAERQLIQDRRRVTEANNAIDFRRSQAMRSDPELQRINGEIEFINQQRQRDAEDARINRTEVDPERDREQRDRLARLEAEREERLRNLTQAEREAADEIAREIDARARLIAQIEKERQFDEEVRNRQNPVGDPMRGLDLLETPSQRAARDAAQQAADAIAAFDEQVRGLFDANGGLPNESILAQSADLRKQLNAGLDEVFSSAARGAAPAIAELFDQVQNAVVQGPSRAALNVTDVSTQEGSRELTRLLRGDDSARNVNVVQLERQNQSLIKIIEVMTKVEEKIGMTIDLK